MQTWVKAVAVWHGFAAMATLGLVAVGAVFGPPSTEPDDVGFLWLLLGLGAAFGGILAAVTVGLWRYRVWARTGAITLAVVLLLSGGGTLPAVVTLIVLLHPKGRALFIPEPPGPEGSAPSLD